MFRGVIILLTPQTRNPKHKNRSQFFTHISEEPNTVKPI